MALSLPTVRQLEILLALARTQNFSRAAEAMGMSQSALSQAIAQMEFVLDVKLVNRTRRSVSLTRAGEILVQKAESIIRDLQTAVRSARDEADPNQGRVVLACLSSVLLRLLPPVIREFRKRWPEATLVIREEDPELCIRQVKAEMADLAICMMMSPEPAVEFEPLLEDRFRFVCNRSHPLAGRSQVEWSELAHYDFVGMQHWSEIKEITDSGLQGSLSRRRAVYEVSRVPTVISIVEEADVVSAIPALVLSHPSIQNRIHHGAIGSPTISRRIGVVTRRNAPLSATADAFCKLLRTNLSHSSLFCFPDVRPPAP